MGRYLRLPSTRHIQIKKIRCCTFEIPGMDKIEKLILVSIIISTPLRDMGMLVCVGWGGGNWGGRRRLIFGGNPTLAILLWLSTELSGLFLLSSGSMEEISLCVPDVA